MTENVDDTIPSFSLLSFPKDNEKQYNKEKTYYKTKARINYLINRWNNLKDYKY